MSFVNSTDYNSSAQLAVGLLDSTTSQIQQTANVISTGKQINGPADNPAVWGLAQRNTSNALALDSVLQSLQRNQSVNDTAVAAGQQVVDLLNQIKTVVVAAADPSLDSASRAQDQSSFTNLVSEINNVVSGASFNGDNLIQSGATALFALGDVKGALKITLAPQVLAVGVGHTFAGGIQFTAGAAFSTATSAAALLSLVNTSISNVTNQVAALGANDVKFNAQIAFVQTLQQSINQGVANQVDADLAKTSAKYQALQTKQQLASQAVNITNHSGSNILTLFR